MWNVVGFSVFMSLSLMCSQPWASGVGYFWDPDDRAWNESRDYCEAIGLQLASLHTKTEFESAVNLLREQGPGENAWISLRLPEDKSSEAYYRWLDGSSLNWTVWSSGVPDAMDNKKCVVLRMDDEAYHTEDCDATHSTLCQDVATSGPLLQRTAFFNRITHSDTSSRSPQDELQEKSLLMCAKHCLSAHVCRDFTYGGGICSLYTPTLEPCQLCSVEECDTYRRQIK